MLGIHDLALFIVSGLLLNMMPGPDSLLIMLRSGSQGWRAGSMAALGIGTGTMVHVLANRSFKDYDDILDACTSAWKHFIADVERVMSLCSRDWIKLT